MATLTLRVTDQLDRKLRHLAKETERPKSYFIKKALEFYLQEYEDYEIALARQVDKDDKILTMAQMRKSLGV